MDKFLAKITKGKYKGKVGLINKGPTNEDILQFEIEWYNCLNEKEYAKKIIDSMATPNSPGLSSVVGEFIRIEDASALVSKYMAEFHHSEFSGGCCG
jgi:hypothetical protein